MKHMKKLLVVVAALAMAMAMTATAFAATQTAPLNPADADDATVTINNPAKGETYSLYKLFDATVSADGAISYQGTVPESLAEFFKVENGNVIPNDSICEKDADGKITGTKMTDELKAALEAWAGTAVAVNSAESNGMEALAFTGLPYGYYVVTTTHTPDGEDAKAAITVTSTMPNASIYDKNSNIPTVEKTVEHESYSIGDRVKYTATFGTTNYMGEGENSKQVVDYVIKDTLPPYLFNVEVSSIKVDDTPIGLQQFDSNKTITIPWATKDESVTPAKFTSLYKQGAVIEIQYEATLTDVTNVGAADKNTVSIMPEVDNDNGDKVPWEKSWSDDAEITTYAAALKKTDGSKALAGAEFAVAGLTAVQSEPGVYTVQSYNPESTEAGTTLKTDENGKLYIVGLASDVILPVAETKAPEGYNKLDGTTNLAPQAMSKQIYKRSGFEKYDADGNLVEFGSEEFVGSIEVTKNISELDENAVVIVNESGVELPSTGGMGTTILYVIGGIMVLLAVVFLITKKRVASKKNDSEMI